MTFAYHRMHGMDTRIVRIFNTYGPRMRVHDGRALPEFFAQALSGKPVTVHGDGSQTRSFCYVDDTVAGIETVLDKGTADPVNVGAVGEISILEIAKRVIALTGSKSPIVHVDGMVDDPRRREPDLTRVKALGWQPKVPLAEGLARTVSWFREALAAGTAAGAR